VILLQYIKLSYIRSLIFVGLLVIALLKALSVGAEPSDSAERWYREGFRLQQKFRTLEALESYRRALELDPGHPRTHYEIGWSYWLLEDWPRVVRHWEAALEAKVGVPELPEYLAMARERLERRPEPLVRVPLHTVAEGGGLRLELVARFQNYKAENGVPGDTLDQRIFSPKSVQIAPDGGKAYVQALEGLATLVYDTRRLERRKAIPHHFDEGTAGLFDPAETAALAPLFRERGAPEAVNVYDGKPVEGVFSHGGRYLWVSHYRRSYDALGVLPSSLAVIDTATDEIVRVMQSGPIPKFLAASPDGRRLAVVHWGDNTVGLIDIAAADPAGFRHAGEIVVEARLPLELERKVNRDRYCGLCLRGAVFTADSRTLLVGRMGGGGIAVLDVALRKHVGSVAGMKPTPRHLLLSPDGTTLYVGSNSSGYISRYDTAALIAAAHAGRKRLAPLAEAASGRGTRTIALSPDGATLYAAIHDESALLALDARTLRRKARIATDSYPVGLAVTPDGSGLWVTAQGVRLRGGNAVSLYRVSAAPWSAAPATDPPREQP
jgi:DNA-binding beta-propeller fold protein YncE